MKGQNYIFTVYLRRVKTLSYILAFYVILLSAIPCCAFDNCPDDKIESSTQHESNDRDYGNCSPFFNCESCATVLINFEPLQFEAPFAPTISVYTGYIQLSLPKINYEFWQPPKLG